MPIAGGREQQDGRGRNLEHPVVPGQPVAPGGCQRGDRDARGPRLRGERLVQAAGQLVGHGPDVGSAGEPTRDLAEGREVGAARRALVQVVGDGGGRGGREESLLEVREGVEIRMYAGSRQVVGAHGLGSPPSAVARSWRASPGSRSWSAGLGGGTWPSPARFPWSSRSSGRSRARPRAQRLLTVPGAQSSTWAVSSTDQPYMSTSTSAARCSTGQGVQGGHHVQGDVQGGERIGHPGPRLGLRERIGGAHGAAAHPVQAGVHHDAVQPRGHRRVTTEGGRRPRAGCRRRGRAQCRDERVLDGVRGLLAVSHRAHGHRPEPVTVATEELTERLGVTRRVGAEQGCVGQRGKVGPLRHLRLRVCWAADLGRFPP